MQNIFFKKILQLDYRVDEAYKRLRTNLQLCGDEYRVIAVTSCIPNDGKSTTSFNLAVSLSQLGKRVLYVDADLRKSVIVKTHSAHGAKYGLSHYLTGMKPLNDVVGQTNIENLYVITAGPVPPNPSELLGNARFESLISSSRKAFDYVIIDTPPLGSVVDASVVGRMCDGIVLVIPSNNISYKFAQRVMEDINQIDTKFLGVILNKFKGAEGGKYYGKYYGNYTDEYDPDAR